MVRTSLLKFKQPQSVAFISLSTCSAGREYINKAQRLLTWSPSEPFLLFLQSYFLLFSGILIVLEGEVFFGLFLFFLNLFNLSLEHSIVMEVNQVTFFSPPV